MTISKHFLNSLVSVVDVNGDHRPALLTSHGEPVAMAAKPRTSITEFLDSVYSVLCDEDDHHFDLLLEDARQKGREDMRDDLTWWKKHQKNKIERMRETLEGLPEGDLKGELIRQLADIREHAEGVDQLP